MATTSSKSPFQASLPLSTDRSHVDRLPLEILSHIFQILSDIDSRAPLIVSWVSQHWRTVALSTHSLWNTITTLDFDMILEYISRNPTYPITLTVVCYSSRLIDTPDYPALVTIHDLQPRLQNISLRVVYEDAERGVERWEKLLGLLFCLPGYQDYPQLRTLSIQFPLKPTSPAATNILPVIVNAPELQDLHLRGLVFNSHNHAYPFLRVLSIMDAYLDRPIYSILWGMSKLEYLSLVFVEIYGPNLLAGAPKGKLVLDNLRTLRILRPIEDQLYYIHCLLALLHAPNLKHFEWEVNYDSLATPLSFWGSCTSRFRGLTSLHLMGFPSELPGEIIVSQTLLGWLESLRYLESFILIFNRSCLYNYLETELGMVTVLQRLAETQGDEPACCAQLRSLHIGPIIPRELSDVQSVVQARPRLRAGTLHIIQYVDTKRSAGDVSWLQANVGDFAVETVSGHGRGFRYGSRHRYVGGTLRKYSGISEDMLFERAYFDQVEQSSPLV